MAGKYIYIAGEDSASDASISLLGNDAMEGTGCTNYLSSMYSLLIGFFERTNSNNITCFFSFLRLLFNSHIYVFWDSFTHSFRKFQGLLCMFP